MILPYKKFRTICLYPLSFIKTWLDHPPDQPLFTSSIRFQNYPVDTSTVAEQAVDHYQGIDWWPYPLDVVVEPDSRLRLRLTYDRHQFEPAPIRRMLETLHTLLTRFGTSPQLTLATLLAQM